MGVEMAKLGGHVVGVVRDNLVGWAWEIVEDVVEKSLGDGPGVSEGVVKMSL